MPSLPAKASVLSSKLGSRTSQEPKKRQQLKRKITSNFNADQIVDEMLLPRYADARPPYSGSSLDSAVSFSSETNNFLHARSSNFLLQPRQQYQYFALPTSYKNLNSGPPAGEVVGITLGATLGFLVAFYLIFVVMANSAAAVAVGDEEVEVRRHHHHRSNRSQGTRRTMETRRRRHRASIISESSRSSTPLPAPPPPAPPSNPPRPASPRRIIIEETRTTRERSRPPPPPSSTHGRTTIIEQETRVEGDDMVEVMEEHSISDMSPRPRRKSGYRPVDPLAYGGGDFPLRSVSRRRSPSIR